MEPGSEWQRIWTKTGQVSIFDIANDQPAIQPLRELLVWNVGHPSNSRAMLQLEWLQSQGSEVIVLSETAQSKGCEHLLEGLASKGYRVVASLPHGSDYGSI